MNLHDLTENSYYTNEYGIVLLNDCLQGMKNMDDNIVDVSFTSPPPTMILELKMKTQQILQVAIPIKNIQMQNIEKIGTNGNVK